MPLLTVGPPFESLWRKAPPTSATCNGVSVASRVRYFFASKAREKETELQQLERPYFDYLQAPLQPLQAGRTT